MVNCLVECCSVLVQCTLSDEVVLFALRGFAKLNNFKKIPQKIGELKAFQTFVLETHH